MQMQLRRRLIRTNIISTEIVKRIKKYYYNTYIHVYNLHYVHTHTHLYRASVHDMCSDF